MPSTTGERLFGNNLSEIAPNHVARYQYAIDALRGMIPTGGRVLDAACGCGYGSKMLADAGYQVVAVDRDDEAEQWQSKFEHKEVWFTKMDIMELPPDPFDAVVSIETIEHVPWAEAWINLVGAMTNVLVGTVPNESVVPFNPKKHPWHYRHFTLPEIESLMAGWSLSNWATQYGKWENYEMVPGTDGVTLGFLAQK